MGIIASHRARVAGAVLLLLTLVGGGLWSARPTGAEGRTVTVSKATGLANGETITVSWSGFTEGPAYLHQCETGATSWRQCSEVTRLVAETGPDGTGTVQYTVRGNQNGQPIPSPQIPGFGNDPLSCAGGSCTLFVSECSFDVTANRTASKQLVLTAQGINAPTSTTSSSSTTSTTSPEVGDITKPQLTAAGTSEPALAIEAWQNAAIADPLAIDLNYTTVNSPSGNASFVAGENDIAITNQPLSADQATALADQQRGFTYVPIGLSAQTVALGMKVNGIPVTDLQLSLETLAKTYNGSSSFLNEPVFTADNGGCRIPSSADGPRYPLPVIRTDQSWANLLYSTWLHEGDATLWPAEPNVLMPTDDSRLYGATGARAVAELLRDGLPTQSGPAADRANSYKAGRIGYLDRSWAEALGLTQVRLKNASGAYVAPTDEAILAAFSHATKQTDGTYQADLFTDDPVAYPLVQVTYAVVPTTLTDSFTAEKGATLAELLAFITSDAGQQIAAEQGLVPLPAAARADAQAAIAEIPTKDPDPDPDPESDPVDESFDDTYYDDFGDVVGFDDTYYDGGFDDEAAYDDGAYDEGAYEDGSFDDGATGADPSAGDTGDAGEEESFVIAPIAAVLGAAGTVAPVPVLLVTGLLALAIGPALRARANRRGSA